MLALAGGVGGAKLADGLAQLAGDNLTVIVNTADDFDHFGLRICPDLDTVMYTLAGLANPETGWGLRGETWSFLNQMRALGGPDWFRLGDRDLATHVMRTARLSARERLTCIVASMSRALGIPAEILPMTDDDVRTIVVTDDGELGFQDYFVRLQCRAAVKDFRFAGAASAALSPEIELALDNPAHEFVVICPSNPFVSIEPILSVPGLRKRLKRSARPIIAVSPIVGGKAIKGPAAKMMQELGLPVSSYAVAERYRGLVDGMIIDRDDAREREGIESLGISVVLASTVMRSGHDRAGLAQECVRFARELAEAKRC